MGYDLHFVISTDTYQRNAGSPRTLPYRRNYDFGNDTDEAGSV